MRSSPFNPTAATPRFWGTSLVALAVLANLACVCGVAAAPPAGRVASEEAAARDTHACCRRPDPGGKPQEVPSPAAPAHRGQDGCPHCGNGTLTVERNERSDVPSLDLLGFSFPADALITGSLPGFTCSPLPNRAAGPPESTSVVPTLLGLHCALNL